MNIEYILCHGSGNKFVMIDSVERDLSVLQQAEFVVEACKNNDSDGVLFLTRYQGDNLAMRMFNTDGSEAEMCGNGMRCIARLADERYLHTPQFTLYSGGRPYPIKRCEPLAAGVATYSVDISIATATPDFLLGGGSRFVDSLIEPLSPTLRWSYLNLGNPHIVALTDKIELSQLEQIGQKVKSLQSIFPNGVNVSLMKLLGRNKIFVATFERGVGLTASCGTAMTASSTAAVLLGICDEGQQIEVVNRGGVVSCCSRLEPSIVTQLSGNATFQARGVMDSLGRVMELHPEENEVEAWCQVLKSLSEKIK